MALDVTLVATPAPTKRRQDIFGRTKLVNITVDKPSEASEILLIKDAVEEVVDTAEESSQITLNEHTAERTLRQTDYESALRSLALSSSRNRQLFCLKGLDSAKFLALHLPRNVDAEKKPSPEVDW